LCSSSIQFVSKTFSCFSNFTGEQIVREIVEGDLRCSFEWVGDRWLNFPPRKDVATRLPLPDVLENQVGSEPDMQKLEDEAAKPAPQKTILHCSIEELGLQSGKMEPPKPAADKVSLHYSQEGGGITVADGAIPDAKRPRVDLTNVLKSKNVLKWAERKARGSGPLIGYSDGSSQEGNSTPNGDTEPVNSVPAKEECKNNEQAPVSTTPPTIDRSDD
jgi:hypothetical protein